MQMLTKVGAGNRLYLTWYLFWHAGNFGFNLQGKCVCGKEWGVGGWKTAL